MERTVAVGGDGGGVRGEGAATAAVPSGMTQNGAKEVTKTDYTIMIFALPLRNSSTKGGDLL